MSVPTHNLYDFVYQSLKKKYLIYYFYPYGEKTLEHAVNYHKNYHYKNPEFKSRIKLDNEYDLTKRIFPDSVIFDGLIDEYNKHIICNDQEPLDFDFYEDEYNNENFIQEKAKSRIPYVKKNTKNFRWINPSSWQKKWIILHSEKNSHEIKKYENTGNYVCAYWWSNAILSLDWYRFAEKDQFLNPSSDIKKRFLIYPGRLENKDCYRTKFLSKLSSTIKQNSQIGSFLYNDYRPSMSAEYDFYDLNHTGISVILETVFDQRVHHTEKTLRAIATGHPFIIMNGPGSLNTIKQYGFKTFSPFINESYDKETNTEKRMSAVITELDRISNLNEKEFNQLIQQCKKIAEYNKNLFFSKEFYSIIQKELITNIENADKKCNNEMNIEYIWEFRKYCRKHRFKQYKSIPDTDYAFLFYRHLKKGGTLENYVPPDSD